MKIYHSRSQKSSSLEQIFVLFCKKLNHKKLFNNKSKFQPKTIKVLAEILIILEYIYNFKCTFIFNMF